MGRSRWLMRGSACFVLLLAAGMTSAVGCGDDAEGDDDDDSSNTTIVERLAQGSVDKLDLLLAIDNSQSMSDKQQILALAVPDLIHELVNPWCVDSLGGHQRVAGPLEDCPAGMEREFAPVLDVHVGIISSSLGDHGGDICPDASASNTNNDMGRLITRDADGLDHTAATYQGLGFLAWDPAQRLTPPGETNIDALLSNVQMLVAGAGERGCGFEAQLESWYRFLVDPEPYLTIEVEAGAAVPSGIDTVIIDTSDPQNPRGQRVDFMRPDSLLAIILLSDENDCSIRDGGQYFYAAKAQDGAATYHLPRAQITCQTDPNDECCRSCGQSDDGCPPKGDECATAHDNLNDQINLRCFDQKRRFGIDFLYPVDRYVRALTEPMVPDRAGNLVPNPIFSDLNPNDDISNTRDPALVVVAGIVGVPWQDIARQDANGLPDLHAGLNAAQAPVGGFRSSDELVASGIWDVILGDPDHYVAPTDPLMIESVDPRAGANPITGDLLAPPGSGYMQNPINGHEWTIGPRNDLQYACIFPLPQPRDCAAPPAPLGCDCSDGGNDNPLCQDPSGTFGTTQYSAKAYPGRRELQLLRDVGAQGVVASICPPQQSDPGARDFGYRPAVQSIVERLKQSLGSQCLPRSLTVGPQGRAGCLVVEARRTGGSCDCGGNGRQPLEPASSAVVEAIMQDPLYQSAQWDCFCEIQQLTDDELVACQYDASSECPAPGGSPVHGWCYVDATTDPPTGDPDIVAGCPESEQRLIRFVCDGQAAPDATVFISCAGGGAAQPR